MPLRQLVLSALLTLGLMFTGCSSQPPGLQDSGTNDAGSPDAGCVGAACPPRCGDGVIGTAEACDDHNADAGDGCGIDCSVERGFVCVGQPSVCATTCGDGMVGGKEACDDQNALAND